LEFLILLLLVIILSAHYLPEFLRQRALDSPLETINEFHRSMSALEFSTANLKTGIQLQGAQYQSNRPAGRYLRQGYPGYDDSLYEGDFIPYPRNRAQIEMRIRRQRVLAVLFLILFGTLIPCLMGAARWFIFLHAGVFLLTSVYTFLALFICERKEI